jgi:uncharacterized membrane protein
MTSTAAALHPQAPAPLPPAARTTRAVALACLLALIVLGLAWELWLAPTGRGTLALKVVPLLLPLPGLWRGRLYTFRWTCLLVWLYFTEGVVRAMGDTGLSAALAGAEVGLSLGLFTACAWHARSRSLRRPPSHSKETRR